PVEPLRAAPDEEVAAVDERLESVGIVAVHLEAVLPQIEILDDLSVQQMDVVGAVGDAEAGVDLLGGDGSADARQPLEDQDLQAVGGEIAGRDEPIVAAADDDDVVLEISHELLGPGGARSRRPAP